MGLMLEGRAIGPALCFGCASRFSRLDQVAAEDLASGEVADGDVVVVGEREDAFAGVFGADAEVVHPASAAEAHLAGVVEAVVAQPVVALGVPVAGRERFGCGAVGVAWRASVKRAVWALLVVAL